MIVTHRPFPSLAKRLLRWSATMLCCCLLLAGGLPSVIAAEPAPKLGNASAAELLAESTLAYAELPRPDLLVERIPAHPLATQATVQSLIQLALESPDVTKFRLGLGFVELGLGQTWQTLVQDLLSGGVYVAIDGDTKQAVLLVRAKDAESLDRIRTRALKLAGDDATRKGQPNPFETKPHRGVTTYKVDRAHLATFGPWLFASEAESAVHRLIDRGLDGAPQSLAQSTAFAAAHANRPRDAIAWAFLRIDQLRDSGLAPGLKQAATDNPAAELLVGGVLANLQKTSHVTVELRLTDAGLALALATPHQRDWVPEPRQFFFGPAGQGAAPPPLSVPGRLAVLRTWRDVGGMWAAAPDLFDEKVNGELAQANSNLSTILGGKDFGQDVLQSLGAELQIVAAKPVYEKDAPTPTIKLPAFGAVARLRDPDSAKRLWKVMFQTLIGFINIGGGMNGLPLLEMELEKVDDVQFVSGQYSPPEKKAGDNAAVGIHYNFTPTLAVVGDQLVLASSRHLAIDLARAIRSAETQRPTANLPAVNTELTIDGDAAVELLHANREQLVAQNMLEKGHDRAAADREIGFALQLADLLEQFGLRLLADDQSLRLELELKPRLGPARAAGEKP